MFKRCFIAWVGSFQQGLQEVVAIDGKTLRKSFDESQSAIHMVSAFATRTQLVLGQEKVDSKSNEITAIPKLLDLLSITGAIVSIDAMGTQKQIASKIRDKQADYVLALKGNHSTLHRDISLFLSTEVDKLLANKACQIVDSYQEHDKGHGRIEHRCCYVTDALDWLEQREQWRDLRSVALVESRVTTGDKTTTERRYFISSLAADAKEVAQAIRSHWAIENSLHWVLDVSLGEDNSRIRKDNAPENMAMIRHMVVNMLRGAKSHFRKDTSLKGLQRKAGWGNSTLDLIIKQKF